VACCCLACCCLQPHGRDESLITPKMWKHILVQGLYQMFWLFFWMYAGPLLFSKYHLTSHCSYLQMGSDDNHPTYCSSALVGSLGYSPQNATFYCGAMTACGFAGGCPAVERQTAACPFQPLMPSGVQVPGDAAAAFAAIGPCPGCPTLDEYNAAVTFMDKAYLHEAEMDWELVDSMIFNSFIWLQVKLRC